jgi:hypothetical protein
VPISQAQGAIVTIRTGQVAGAPGSCLGADDTFRRDVPQPLCSFPIPLPFGQADFDNACSGAPAVVVAPETYTWVQSLPCDPDARWIASQLSQLYPAQCYGERQSALYCAAFSNPGECTVADSIRICWAVDDYLGDPPAFPGPNPGGIYVNGNDLGPAFSGLGASQQRTAVATNVPLLPGVNRLQVYQRDAGCGVAGLILSARIYTCGTLAVEPRPWTAVKRLYE